MSAFATKFRVIGYSRRFFPPNASPRATDVSPLGIHVADLRTLITDLKAGPAHLVGSSYGAYIALVLAIDHPELVRSLVLGEPPIWPLLSRTSVAESMRQSLIRRAEATRRAFESGSFDDGMRRFVDAICATPSCFDNLPEAQRTALLKEQAPAVRSEFMTEPSALMPPLECGVLDRLTRPTLLVTGERSQAMFLLVTTEVERCLEGERQVMVPDAGHGMHSQNAAFNNQAVMAFLQQR